MFRIFGMFPMNMDYPECFTQQRTRFHDRIIQYNPTLCALKPFENLKLFSENFRLSQGFPDWLEESADCREEFHLAAKVRRVGTGLYVFMFLNHNQKYHLVDGFNPSEKY